MGEFFFMIIGYFIFLFVNYNRAAKIGNLNCFYQEDRKEYAVKYNKPVWYYGIKNNNPIYLETTTNQEVYKGIDNYGFERWFYKKSNKPIIYAIDKRIEDKLNINILKAKENNKKWCILENFWDDSIIRLENSIGISNTYLDDYRIGEDPFQILAWNEYARNWNKNNPDKIPKKIINIRNNIDILRYSNISQKEKQMYQIYFYNNNPVHQKIYINNMRPYQLYLLGESETGKPHDFIIKRQYLIRFGKKEYFNLTSRYCIYDKQISDYWTKWYAISEQEYLELTTIIKDNLLNTKSSLQMCLRPIKLNDIAFCEGNDSIKWDMVNCGIKQAFDINYNFIEE